MQTGAGIPYLRARDQRQTVNKSRGRGSTAGALRDVLVHLAFRIGARPKPLDRGINHSWVDLLNSLPGETHPVECARGKVFDHHITGLNQPCKYLLTFLVLGVER